MGLISGMKRRKHVRDAASMLSKSKRIELRLERELKRIGVDVASDEVSIYFKRLGISRTSDKSRIRDAYIRRIKEYHPDVSPRADAEEKAKELNEAYAALSGKGFRISLVGADYGRQKKMLAERIIGRYNAERKRDYERISADLRSRSLSYEAAVRKMFDWEARYDRTCTSLFGELWRIGSDAAALSERNSELVSSERDASLVATLEESQRRIEAARAEYKAVEALLSDVIGDLRYSIAKSESEARGRSGE